MPTDKETDWIYRESTKKLLMRLLLAGCAISVLLELFVLGRKEKFGVDGWFGFYAFLGFVSCTLMIFAAKGFGALVEKFRLTFTNRRRIADNNLPPKKDIAEKATKKSTRRNKCKEGGS